jgi:hypothetical protein
MPAELQKHQPDLMLESILLCTQTMSIVQQTVSNGAAAGAGHLFESRAFDEHGK